MEVALYALTGLPAFEIGNLLAICGPDRAGFGDSHWTPRPT